MPIEVANIYEQIGKRVVPGMIPIAALNLSREIIKTRKARAAFGRYRAHVEIL